MDVINTGNFLRDLRKERNLTQEELGELLGVTNKTISRWENGQYFPPVESLIQLGKIFNVTVNEILAGARLDDANYQPKAEENIVATLKKSQKNNRVKRTAIICCSIILVIAIVFAAFWLTALIKRNVKEIVLDRVTVMIKAEYKDRFIAEDFTIDDFKWDNIESIEHVYWFEKSSTGWMTVRLKKHGKKQVRDAVKHFNTLQFVEVAEIIYNIKLDPIY